MTAVRKLVTQDSFVNGVLVRAGQIATYDNSKLNGKEKHLKDVDKNAAPAIIEMAAISPSGPNPRAPQQISPDTYQGPGGVYQRPGAIVVGEKTVPADERLSRTTDENSTAEGDIVEELRKARAEIERLRANRTGTAGGSTATTRATGGQNTDDALVEGTVAEVTADIDKKSDAELEALRAAEVDREKPRSGVLNAIKAEQDRRTAQS